MASKSPAEILQRMGAQDRPTDETSIVFSGARTSAPEAERLWAAFEAAIGLQFELPSDVLAMPGMSGRKYRRLINRLIQLTPDASYLEVGSWAGSSACSAMAGNRLRLVCIDNWSEFGKPYEAFLDNIARYRTEDIDIDVVRADFRDVDFAGFRDKFNVYMYDGPHEFEDQYDGICMAIPALAPVSVIIVDDWNWPDVREATWKALKDCGVEVLYSIQIRTTQTDEHSEVAFQASDWHNGYILAVCRKPG